MKWKSNLISYLVNQLSNDFEWNKILNKIENENSIGIHLAVFTEPFLSLVCEGEKKIETRFSQNKISPFERVNTGDVVIVKQSGGFIKAVFIAGEVKFYYSLNNNRLKEIEEKYAKLICSDYDSSFWEIRSKTSFATLIEITYLRKLPPFYIEKKDRIAWTTLELGYGNTLFNN